MYSSSQPNESIDLLLGGDLSGDAADERGDEQSLIEQVLHGSWVAPAGIERLRSAEGGAGCAAVGVGELGDDVGVRVAEIVAGVQVALLVGVVLGFPGVEVGGWDERAPEGREAVAVEGFPAGGFDGFEAGTEILGQEAFVAQVEQIADQVVSLGRQSEVGQVEAGLGAPAADVELDDNPLARSERAIWDCRS